MQRQNVQTLLPLQTGCVTGSFRIGRSDVSRRLTGLQILPRRSSELFHYANNIHNLVHQAFAGFLQTNLLTDKLGSHLQLHTVVFTDVLLLKIVYINITVLFVLIYYFPAGIWL